MPPMAYGAAKKAVQPVDGSILTIDGGGRAVGRPVGLPMLADSSSYGGRSPWLTWSADVGQRRPVIVVGVWRFKTQQWLMQFRLNFNIFMITNSFELCIYLIWKHEKCIHKMKMI